MTQTYSIIELHLKFKFVSAVCEGRTTACNILNRKVSFPPKDSFVIFDFARCLDKPESLEVQA